jgi:uncharacterized protein
MPNQGLMSETVARQAITWLFAMSGRAKEVHITFFGGEPLLNKPVLRFAIEYSQKLGKLHGKKVRYSMTTNGTLLDDEVIGYIKRYNFGLMVSLDGPPEVHNAQCPFKDGSGSFDAAAAGIKKLMQRRKRVTVRCTMTKNAPPMMDLIRFFEDFGFTRIVLGPAINPINPTEYDSSKSGLKKMEHEEEGDILPWILNRIQSSQLPPYFPYASFFRRASASRHSEKPGVFTCGACRGTTTVGADGKMYPCHRFLGMKTYVFGDIVSGVRTDAARDFWMLWRSRQEIKCTSCWAAHLCHCFCPWAHATSDGMFTLPNADQCKRFQRWVKRAAWLYYYVMLSRPALCRNLANIE